MTAFYFLAFLSASAAAAATGSLFLPGAWYQSLKKPDWTPPKKAFPIIWTALYIASAIAATRVALSDDPAPGLALWSVQIALNRADGVAGAGGQFRAAESFRQSRTQVAADIARAVSLGRRGM